MLVTQTVMSLQIQKPKISNLHVYSNPAEFFSGAGFGRICKKWPGTKFARASLTTSQYTSINEYLGVIRVKTQA